MTIAKVYEKYRIMPQLAEHQFKVAGVAKLLCENLKTAVDCREVVAACLLHDMGNIIKFDLKFTAELLPGRFAPAELKTWQEVKDSYLEKYGPDEHHATLLIGQELGVGERILELIDCIGFQNGQSNAASPDFGKKICAYSDMRVGPLGVISLEQRFADLRDRYEHKHRLMGGNETARLEFENGLREIEAQIFSEAKLLPQEITETAVLAAAETLRTTEI